MRFFKKFSIRAEDVIQNLGVKCMEVAVPINIYFRSGNIGIFAILLNIHDHRILEKQKAQDEAFAAKQEVEEIRAAFNKEIKAIEDELGKDKNSKPRP
jgi:hypothetical protein